MLWTPKTKAERVGNLKVRKSFKLLSVILAGLLFTTGVCYAAVNNIKKVEKKAKGSIYEQILDDHGFIYGINFSPLFLSLHEKTEMSSFVFSPFVSNQSTGISSL